MNSDEEHATRWRSRCHRRLWAQDYVHMMDILACVGWLLLFVGLMAIAGAVAACAQSSDDTSSPTPQNPSPMVEYTRRHGRIEETRPPGTRLVIDGLFRQPVHIYLSPSVDTAEPTPTLLIHFHGAAFVPEHAAYRAEEPYVLAVIHLGVGSGVYAQAFADSTRFSTLLSAIHNHVQSSTGRNIQFSRVYLSAFSAGYAAIREILHHGHNRVTVDGVILLDGIHTGYIPKGKVLYRGGRLDTSKLAPFITFARLALDDEKAMLITHSEIFPGTFASTTETTDYLLRTLGLERTPVLKWGPHGMQQLSKVRRGTFLLLGFAGNTAPDHIDHFHGLSHFLEVLSSLDS